MNDNVLQFPRPGKQSRPDTKDINKVRATVLLRYLVYVAAIEHDPDRLVRTYGLLSQRLEGPVNIKVSKDLYDAINNADLGKVRDFILRHV